MSEEAKLIAELFAAPTGDIEPVVNLGGVEIFTSKSLKQNYVKAMAKTPIHPLE